MGFSSQQYRQKKDQRPWKIHPAWRGIGCVLLLLIPIMSWFGSEMFLQTNSKVALPWQLTRVVAIPYTRVVPVDRIIAPVNHFFSANGLIFGQLFFTIILTFIGFGIMGFLYAVLYRVVGPPRYGPFDVPPNRV